VTAGELEVAGDRAWSSATKWRRRRRGEMRRKEKEKEKKKKKRRRERVMGEELMRERGVCLPTWRGVGGVGGKKGKEKKGKERKKD